jgi:hypothetical protein
LKQSIKSHRFGKSNTINAKSIYMHLEAPIIEEENNDDEEFIGDLSILQANGLK